MWPDQNRNRATPAPKRTGLSGDGDRRPSGSVLRTIRHRMECPLPARLVNTDSVKTTPKRSPMPRAPMGQASSRCRHQIGPRVVCMTDNVAQCGLIHSPIRSMRDELHRRILKYRQLATTSRHDFRPNRGLRMRSARQRRRRPRGVVPDTALASHI